MNSIIEHAETILAGIGFTALTALLTLAFATAMAFLMATLRLLPGTTWLARAYVNVFQNTPYPVLVFLIFYGLPEIGIRLDAMASTVVGIGLYSSAYLAEALRTGVQAVPRGNFEAGLATGMSRLSIIIHIVLKQALVYALPSLSNQWCRGLRNISVMAMIGGHEILFVSSQLADKTFLVFLYYGVAGVAYWLLSIPISGGVRRLEQTIRWHTTRTRRSIRRIRREVAA